MFHLQNNSWILIRVDVRSADTWNYAFNRRLTDLLPRYRWRNQRVLLRTSIVYMVHKCSQAESLNLTLRNMPAASCKDHYDRDSQKSI